MFEVFWNRLTAQELVKAAEADAIVLLPVASTEQHGPHLTTGVDTFLATEGCRRVAARVIAQRAIVVAPTVWMGLAEHHVEFGGTFTISLATYHAMLRELCRSILRAKFRKILIVNGHGGNIAALAALTTELAQELSAPIATTTLYDLAHQADAYAPILDDQTGVQHACEAETSMMLAAFADCVRADQISAAFNPRGIQRGRKLGNSTPALNLWRSYSAGAPTGVMGDARKATAAKGEQLLDIAADLLAAQLIEGHPWAT